MRTTQLVAAAAIWLALCMSAPAADQDFARQDSIRTWSFHNGPEFPGAIGSIFWEATQGHNKPGCLALKYSFAGGGNYVQATGPIPAKLNAKVARVWLKKAQANKVTFRATDSARRTFQKTLQYNNPEWQAIEVNLTRWEFGWGGSDDGKLQPPLKQFGILVENSDAVKEGVLFIDDIEFSADSGREGVKPVSYPAVNWQEPAQETSVAPIGWNVGGGNGNVFNAGNWSYQFNAGTNPIIRTEFPLLGEPSELALFIESDGSGHEVEFSLGSHFQHFSRVAGKLDRKGEQVIRVPLGKLEGWQHAGGENDGQARMPLRLTGIALKAGDGPKSSAIKLKRIEVSTLPRDGQLVTLVPDVMQHKADIDFKVRAINMRPTAVDGTLRCDVRDLGGRISRQQKHVHLAANGGMTDWQIAQEAGDHRFVEAVFQWQDKAFISKHVSIGTCMPPAEPGSSELHPESFMGAGLYLYRHRGGDYKESIARACELARRAGVKWTREEMQWHVTEPAEGTFDWQFYDDMVDIARAHGISVYGLLCYWSNWAEVNTPQGVEQYCQWARAVVRHYKGRINHWEIWNEPNIFFWTGPRELYAELLKKAYEAIKAENPDAVVMGCSTAGIDTNFIKQVMGWGGKFDALTIHPYRGSMDDVHFMQELRDVRELVGGRDVWLTEIGFPSQLIDGWSERAQASLVARTYLCTAASGAGRSVSWYDFRNDGNDPFYNEANFGLVRSDLQLKPAYGTLAAVGNLIGNMHVAGTFDAGQDTCGFRFTDGKRDVVATWSPDDAKLLTVEGEFEQLLNAFGEPIERRGPTVTVTLDAGFPVYFTGKTGFALGVVAPPLTYTCQPSVVRPGGTCTFQIKADRPIAMARWELPVNWPEPRKSGEKEWEVVVPADAPAYEFSIQAVVRTGTGATLRLPARVSIAPAVLHL